MSDLVNMWELLVTPAREYPDKDAVKFGEINLTYAELLRQAEQLAAGLYRIGLRKGDHLALIMPNWPEYMVTFFAVARLGAILVPLNTRYREHELEYMLGNSQVKLVVTCASFDDFDYLKLLSSLYQKVPTLRQVIAVGESPALSEAKVRSWESLIREGERALSELPAVEIDSEKDLFLLLYTSGTTGLPKAAMLTHFNIIWNSRAIARSLECTARDTILASVPFFHIFGTTCCIVLSISLGATLVLMEVYRAEDALRLIELQKVTVHHGVATMFILELNHPRFNSYNLGSLRTGIIAAAPAPAEIIRRIRRDMGCEIASSYGLSETSPALTITSFDDSDEVRAETVGKPLEGVEIKIVNEEQFELKAGEVGELVCRSPGLMKGYYGNPEATLQAIDQSGWFHTGDLATRDTAGNIRIVGRKKEMINRAGFKVYPREIEELFYQHPKVQEVAIIGIPDRVLGEKVVACIKLKEGAYSEAQEMRDFIKEKVADFKVPDLVVFVEAFPMTATGKIRKLSLVDALSNQLKG